MTRWYGCWIDEVDAYSFFRLKFPQLSRETHDLILEGMK